MAFSLHADSLTYPLFFLIISLFLLRSIIRLIFTPTPLTHPFLLANQAQFAPVRRAGQSPDFARYGSAAGGYGPWSAGPRVRDVAEEVEEAKREGWKVLDLSKQPTKEEVEKGFSGLERFVEISKGEVKADKVLVGKGKHAFEATQSNISASLTAHQSLFPAGTLHQPSNRDIILSFFDPSTSAFGLSVALLGLYSRAPTIISPLSDEQFDNPKLASGLTQIIAPIKPTLLYIPASLALALHSHLLSNLHTRYPPSRLSGYRLTQARAGKIAGLRAGTLPSKTIWDAVVFSDLGQPLGPQIRAIFVVGDPLPLSVLDDLRIFLSVAVSHVLAHPAVLGPISGSQLFDFQAFDEDTNPRKGFGTTHVGTVVSGLTGRVVGVDDSKVDGNGNVEGELNIRGASILTSTGEGEAEGTGTETDDGWTRTGIKVVLRSNGTMVPRE